MDVNVDHRYMFPECKTSHGVRSVLTDTRKCLELFDFPGKPAVVIPENQPCKLIQTNRSIIVADPPPCADDVAPGRFRERPKRRELFQEQGQFFPNPGCLSLLKHDFRDKNRVGIARVPPHEFPPVFRIPPENPATDRPNDFQVIAGQNDQGVS